jgi:hypothetical protein
MLYCAPQSLYKHIVKRPTSTIHAHSNAMVFKNTGKRFPAKPTPLIGIEHLRATPVSTDCLFESVYTKVCFQGG